MSTSMLVVAGDVSGDMHAATLLKEVRAARPDLQVFGIGGEQLRAAGTEILYDAREMSVFGLPEVLKRYRFFKRVFEDMVEQARVRRPDVVLLVDYGGFNIRFAQRMHELGLKVIYFICPQVWASRRSRIAKIAAAVDRLMVIFPFEVPLFEGLGPRVDFVGHPLVDEAARALSEPEKALPWAGEPRIALLPGSRTQELKLILPVMLEAAARLEAQVPGASYVIATPSSTVTAIVQDMLRTATRLPTRLEVVEGETRQVLRQARAAWVASGTATIEAALMRCPMAVVYRTSWLLYRLGRWLIRVSHIGMVNVLAGREICPELIQGQATPEALAHALQPLLGETDERKAMLNDLARVVDTLGEGGAIHRAAAIVQEELGCG